MAQLPPLVRSYQALQESDLAESPVPEQIAHGVLLLSQVVTNMDTAVLDRQMTKTLTTFFVDKLSEKASLVPCATALTELVKSPTFGTGEGIEVAKGVLSSVNLKSHPQATRHSVYVLLDHLMSHARPALQRLGSEFISGYCSLVEGEKDPRNLMISFNLVKVILLEFDVAKTIEELFDITFCYFPITFTPPPGDPYGISSEDLIVALRGCLSATPLLGPLALPLFFDKLQAASEKAKRQTLQALVACFPIYGAATCGEWAGRFSEALITEVFHASDDEMQYLALLAVRALYSTLYPDSDSRTTSTTTVAASGSGGDVEMNEAGGGEGGKPPATSTAVEGVAVKMVQNSLDELKEPDKNNAKPAMRILTALVCSSDRLARYILEQSLPPLLDLYKSQDDIALRPSVLSHLATLLASLSAPAASDDDDEHSADKEPPPPKELRTPPTFSHADGASPLEPFRDDLLSILTGSTRALTCRLPALEGLLALVRIPQFLAPSEVDFSVSAIDEVLMHPDGGDEYYDAALDALVVISRVYPRVLERLTLPLLLATLPTATASVSLPLPGSAESDDYRRALEALAALCLHPDLFEILVLRLLARLDETLAISAPPRTSEYTAATLYAHHVLATLRAVIQQKIKQGHVDVAKYVETLVPRLSAMVILPTTFPAAAGGDSSRPVACDPRLVLDVGRVVNLIVQRVEAERQTALSLAVNEAFHRGNLQPWLGTAASGSGPVPFRPFESSSPTTQRNLVALFSALLLAMKPAVALPAADLSVFLRSSLERTLSAQNEVQLAATVHLLGSTVNKRAPDLADFLDSDVESLYRSTIASASAPAAQRRSALRAYSWIAKGLIVRSDQRGYAMIEHLLALFQDAELAPAAAASLGTIAEEKDGVLSKENAAVIRLLYRQRFFTYLLPKLVDLYKTSTADGDQKNIYLVALSSLLRHIPKQLTLTELPKLLPLLMTSLDLPDASLRANVIDALTVLVNDVPSELENAISGITTKVLRGLTVESGERDTPAETKLRLASLAFLSSLPAHIPYLVLHSQKPTILRDLGRALDDPRREVRRAAVECRSQWFLYAG
ncbi:hypothetical protein B0A53_01695 [Rhodotorula sp. CCFEE 5036]|nr:hypothetical protein B0A53_01695 [Rhodotorula sp. CCFEE 5036]